MSCEIKVFALALILKALQKLYYSPSTTISRVIPVSIIFGGKFIPLTTSGKPLFLHNKPAVARDLLLCD